ncbi:alpha/beta fold hydrolase [Yinghuangia sp. YIM S09857]|uniref:alpha/beta fold hydrolase n=1 Tax=Yinghuangia sp. YIM S09857 TaxID=3436929 RepID=UPI003F534D83
MSTPPFLDLPATVRAHRAATARGEFAYLGAVPPDGQPVVGTALLVPGFTGGKEDFIGVLDPPARRGYRVFALDQRGQYETPGPHADPDAYSRAELVADLWAVLDTLAPGEPVHLVGHSFGGLVARSAALDDPARLASLTLMSTGPAAVRDTETARLLMLEDALAVHSLQQVWDAMRQLDAEQGIRPYPDPALAAYMHRRWLANSPAGIAATAQQLRTEPDHTDELAARVAAGLRVLVLSGAQDYAWPVAWQAETARRLGVRHLVVDDAGHSPNAEQPESTAKGLADFWDTAR